MKICGIITEYNPFHLGHEYQIQRVKEEYNVDIIIVVMSGHFVQRGEPALLNQFERTKLALTGGADIVLQLPTHMATSSAQGFAYGAVSLLDSLGCVDLLCFGSESGDISAITSIADYITEEPANYKNALKSELKKGNSYAKARSLALNATFKDSSELLKGSNNILGIEYLKALKQLDSPIKTVTIKREGASYLSEDYSKTKPSASAIRKYFQENTLDSKDLFSSLTHAMPSDVIHVLRNQSDFTPIYMQDIYEHIVYLLNTNTSNAISDIFDFPKELFNRLKPLTTQADTYESFINYATSRNYTKTTIQRSLIHLFLNIRTQDVETMDKHEYIRLLGLKKEASYVIKHIKKSIDLPIITNVKDDYKVLSDKGRLLLDAELRYTRLYNQLIFTKYGIRKNNDYQRPAIVV